VENYIYLLEHQASDACDQCFSKLQPLMLVINPSLNF